MLLQDNEIYGDFEDLETGAKFTSADKNDGNESEENEVVMKVCDQLLSNLVTSFINIMLLMCLERR